MMPVPHHLDYRSFVISLKLEGLSHSTLLFFSKIVFAIHSPYPLLEGIEDTSSECSSRLECLFSVLSQLPDHSSPLFGNVACLPKLSQLVITSEHKEQLDIKGRMENTGCKEKTTDLGHQKVFE
uniref:Uncharacterized protein n=1 Tax=Myotis myotis TaxID=51298 RepID=A0A7J7XZX8_MYOMY|nr:hypothetical protein mMyoMyo1_011325 [Myotis myotis]